MKYIFLALLCLLTQSSFSQLIPAKNPEEVGFSAERLKRLDSQLQTWVAEGTLPNVVTFVARRGKTVHHKAYGFSDVANKKPVRTDDIYRIASQSKALTTVALMQLYEEGKFLLDDPISKYIPAFKNPTVLISYDEKDRSRYITRPAKSEISIRHLLTHTAGIPYEHPLQEQFKVPFFSSLEKETLAEVIPRLAKRPLLHDPGEAFTYGLNTDVLGYLVEILSGMRFDEYITQKITQPLGMSDTYFYLPEAKQNRLVELYDKAHADQPLKLHTNDTYRNYGISGAKTYFSGGAGLLGTIEDYAKLCQMLLNRGEWNGKRILSRSVVSMMTRNQIGVLKVWDRNDGFGFGFEVANPDTHYLDPASPGSFMWGGMYCSEYTIDPTEDLILLVYTNVQPFAHYSEVTRKFRTLVYQALEK